MQTLEKALENLVHNMEILRETLNKQHITNTNIDNHLENTLQFIRDDLSELDTKINELDSKLNSLDDRIGYVFSELNEVKEKIDALGR